MHKVLLFIFFIFLSSFTNFQYDIKKNTDINFILMIINNLSNKKKYEDVLVLYKKLNSIIFEKKIVFYIKYKLAETYFKLQDYSTSSNEFKKIYFQFPKNQKLENFLYLSCISRYKNIKFFNLDQKKILLAINEIQHFINLYPYSNKLIYANEMIQSLYKQIEKKFYYNAFFLYKMHKYESAIIALSNLIFDFPDIEMKENIYYYIILSKYNLIRQSKKILKKEYVFDINIWITKFLRQFPNSRFINTVCKIKNKINYVLLN